MAKAATTKKKKKNPQFVKGPFKVRWSDLDTPDTKFKDEGEYKVILSLTPEEAEQLEEDLKGPISAAKTDYAKAVNLKPKQKEALKGAGIGFSDEVELNDEEEYVETGRIKLKIASKASGVRKKDNKPWSRNIPVFDLCGRPTKKTGVAMANIAFTLAPWVNPKNESGVKLRLEGVQVVERWEGSATAEGMGFSIQEPADDEYDEYGALGDEGGDPGPQGGGDYDF